MQRFMAIRQAVEGLRKAPKARRSWCVRGEKTYRLLIVEGRFLVPYIYYPPTNNRSYGLISIRAVRHGRRRAPLRGVREVPAVPYGARSVSLNATGVMRRVG